MTPDQCREARELLKWDERQLAIEALVSRATVRNFENGRHRARLTTVTAIHSIFEAAGVEFIERNGGGPGVRLRDPVS